MGSWTVSTPSATHTRILIGIEIVILPPPSPVSVSQFQWFMFSVIPGAHTLAGLPVTRHDPGHQYWAVDKYPRDQVAQLGGW